MYRYLGASRGQAPADTVVPPCTDSGSPSQIGPPDAPPHPAVRFLHGCPHTSQRRLTRFGGHRPSRQALQLPTPQWQGPAARGGSRPDQPAAGGRPAGRRAPAGSRSAHPPPTALPARAGPRQQVAAGEDGQNRLDEPQPHQRVCNQRGIRRQAISQPERRELRVAQRRHRASGSKHSDPRPPGADPGPRAFAPPQRDPIRHSSGKAGDRWRSNQQQRVYQMRRHRHGPAEG